MGIYTVKLLEKKEIAKDTMSFTFEKPQGFNFKAGQFGDLTVLNPKETDEGGNVHALSFVSPPYADNLTVATRLRNTAFKRNLKGLPLGMEVKLDAPHGSFTLHNKETTPAVFLTGGIGITPVRSMVLQAAHAKLPHRLFLFYSNDTPETAAFLQELSNLKKSNPNYKFIGTMTKLSPSQNGWKGHTGYIDMKMLKQYIEDPLAPIYYISGPKNMVAAMRKMLNDGGINDDNIRTEEFSGY